MHPDPTAAEPAGTQLGDHRPFPTRKILQNETEIGLMFAAHRRPQIRARLLATPDIGTCGIGCRATGCHAPSAPCRHLSLTMEQGREVKAWVPCPPSSRADTPGARRRSPRDTRVINAYGELVGHRHSRPRRTRGS